MLDKHKNISFKLTSFWVKHLLFNDFIDTIMHVHVPTILLCYGGLLMRAAALESLFCKRKKRLRSAVQTEASQVISTFVFSNYSSTFEFLSLAS